MTENGQVLVLSTSPLPSGATQIADQCTKYGPCSGTVGRSLPASLNQASVDTNLKTHSWKLCQGKLCPRRSGVVQGHLCTYHPIWSISHHQRVERVSRKRTQRRETVAAVGVARASHTPDMPDERCVGPRSAKPGPCWEQYPTIEFLVRYKRYYSVLASWILISRAGRRLAGPYHILDIKGRGRNGSPRQG